jgi:hypothetical protein
MTLNHKKKTILKNVLQKELGWTWLFILMKCFIMSKWLFDRSTWGKEIGDRSNFLRQYAVLVVLYRNLKRKYGTDKALEIMRIIIIPIGCMQQRALLEETRLSDGDPMKKLMAFNNSMDNKGAARFNERVYVAKSSTICHFKMKSCIYKDFFDSFGISELTLLFCEVDKEFFIPAFNEFNVHRGSSWENTLAYGKSECDFVFELKK